MKRLHGVSLTEVMVVILSLLALAVVLSILWPVHGDREPARQTQCLSNVRQMCTAVAMYIQDHNGQLPSAHWSTDLASGGINAKMFTCPASAADPEKGEISYGYNSLLVKPDGKGINEQQMRNPSEVGVLCDADPVGTVGGLVGGGVASDTGNKIPVVIPSNRHVGVIAGFADGYAKYLPGNFKMNSNDYSDPILRTFYMQANIGLVDATGGGIDPLPAGKAGTVTIGGDGCTEPLLDAAGHAWSATTAKATLNTRGFLGQNNTTGQQDEHRRATTWCWGCGDGMPGKNRVIGHDVMVVIVNPSSNIPLLTQKNDRQPTQGGIAHADQVLCATPAEIAHLFAVGYSAGSVQAYTYDEKNGSRAFFKRTFGVKTINPKSVTVQDDREMQDKVAADPYGIGYMSSALVDLTRVQVLGIKKADGSYQIFPQNNVKSRWTKPDTYQGYLGYRDLYVTTHGEVSGVVNVLKSEQFRNCPLYKLGYEVP